MARLNRVGSDELELQIAKAKIPERSIEVHDATASNRLGAPSLNFYVIDAPSDRVLQRYEIRMSYSDLEALRASFSQAFVEQIKSWVDANAKWGFPSNEEWERQPCDKVLAARATLAQALHSNGEAEVTFFTLGKRELLQAAKPALKYIDVPISPVARFTLSGFALLHLVESIDRLSRQISDGNDHGEP